MMRAAACAILLAALSASHAAAAASRAADAPAAAPISLLVDLTDAPRKILHARLTMPVSPGPLTLLYPKWIPGEHGPTGPIMNLAGLAFAVGGKPVAWDRDPVDMYALRLVIPDRGGTLEASFDFLLATDEERLIFSASSSANLAVLNWNQALLYPKGIPVEDLTYAASLKIPAGWKLGTALPIAREAAGVAEFKPVPLETLVDSPVLAGIHFRTIPLAPEVSPRHVLHVAADSPEALEVKPEQIERYSRLVRESGALFGASHYREYHFLYALSDHVSFFGLEHHESSDNRFRERTLIDEDEGLRAADLLPHEFAHSWNGKYRRPADLTPPYFHEPMKTDLLWVYEGLTQYLGWVLAARSGLLTPEQARDDLAETAARLDNEPGRMWRPLLDTAVSAQILYDSPGSWSSWRRDVDFYDESLLFWLEADALIRVETKGSASLDDFCRRFFDGSGGVPEVKTYTLEDVLRTMNEVFPYDWRDFFRKRVVELLPRAPLGGIERGGWRLTYTDTLSAYQKSLEKSRKRIDMRYSLGLLLKDDGTILDLSTSGPSAKAGLAPGMKLIAVNGRAWKAEVMRDATRAASRSAKPIELLAQNGEFFATYGVDYHGGERYPRLVREAGEPDLLTENLTPRAGGAAPAK
ncbi:MAG: M61 family metallopeptidase [Candidatus Latescibacteria bacterium]|nr:M61 family metallopeptidase [Candidatus Latescibacterota bacterium]